MAEQNTNILEKNGLPDGWEVVRVDDCFEVQQGKQVSKNNRIGANQRAFLRTANVFWGRIDLSELDHMNFSSEEEKRFELKKGDLLVCEWGDIGRTALWNYELEKCYYQNHLHRLRIKNGNIDPYYALYWFQYWFVFAKLYFGRANITTIPNLSKSRLSELDINLPPLIEQQAIAETLSSIQSAISEQKNLIEKLRELKRSMMHELFTCGTRGEKTKMTEIGEIPESWKVVELWTLCGKTKNYDPSKFPEKSFAYVDVSSVSNANLRIENPQVLKGNNAPSRARKLIQEWDIIFATVRPTLKRIALISSEYHDQVCSTWYCVLKPKNEILNSYFLYHFLQTDYVLNFVEKEQKWASYPAIRDNDLKGLVLWLPEMSEQIEISNVLNALDLKIRTGEEKLNSIESLFKTLLHELMSGERRVGV